jgi:hypothetical protein
MIDFSEVGTIVVHQVLQTPCLQFLPHEGKTVEDMLQVLDAGLARMNDDSDDKKHRGILLNREKYKAFGKELPIPCVFIFEEEQE